MINLKWNLIKMLAFAKKSLQIMVSYKIDFILTIITPLLWVFLFGMFGRLFEGIEVAALSEYGGDYVSFILLGTLFWQFVSIGLETTSDGIEDEAYTGTIEAIFISPTNTAVAFPGISMVSLLMSGIFTIITIVLGVAVFHFNIGSGNYLLAFLIFVLTYLSTLGIGMIIAALTLVYKNVSSISQILITIMMFISGVYFPVSIMPPVLQKVAAVLPLTYALDGVRKAVIMNADLIIVAKPIIILSALSVITITWGYFFFKWAINRARDEGTLGYY